MELMSRLHGSSPPPAPCCKCQTPWRETSPARNRVRMQGRPREGRGPRPAHSPNLTPAVSLAAQAAVLEQRLHAALPLLPSQPHPVRPAPVQVRRGVRAAQRGAWLLQHQDLLLPGCRRWCLPHLRWRLSPLPRQLRIRAVHHLPEAAGHLLPTHYQLRQVVGAQPHHHLARLFLH